MNPVDLRQETSDADSEHTLCRQLERAIAGVVGVHRVRLPGDSVAPNLEEPGPEAPAVFVSVENGVCGVRMGIEVQLGHEIPSVIGAVREAVRARIASEPSLALGHLHVDVVDVHMGE